MQAYHFENNGTVTSVKLQHEIVLWEERDSHWEVHLLQDNKFFPMQCCIPEKITSRYVIVDNKKRIKKEVFYLAPQV